MLPGTWAARFGDRSKGEKTAPGPVISVSVTDRLRNSEALSTALARHGVTPDDVSLLVDALKGGTGGLVMLDSATHTLWLT